ncbi:MAG: carbamoyltransferase HypF [Anaerolineales bacterium]
MSDLVGRYIRISGIVQGVGFRPFIYRLAKQYQLTGWVKNTSAGVEITVNGNFEDIEEFERQLPLQAPPLSKIDRITSQAVSRDHFTDFQILESQSIETAFIPISPDYSICEDCLRELFDRSDRRYLYPFINCTNCGPRFTIIKEIPYDRPNTTMADFPMCTACADEYHNPIDRRFHAQPIACPVCGPHVWLENKDTSLILDKKSDDREVFQTAQAQLLAGEILAIKGLGGFHLACDALNPKAVNTLRERKRRVDKPFAVMMADIETVIQHCNVTKEEMEMLSSRERPIVIVPKKTDSPIAAEVAPNQSTIGVMLPYTPLHYMLFYNYSKQTYASHPVKVLVMTSGNRSEEPIATENDLAHEQLSELADAYLMHDRPIYIRCDDSVTRVIQHPKGNSQLYPIRRSRGFAPNPIRLDWELPQILACGAELKNTFCLTRANYAFLSHHIGDLENFETYLSLTSGIEHYQKLFRIQPEIVACDKHPNYLSTNYAHQRAEEDHLAIIPVQHHHAHIASCMAENHWKEDKPVIGVSFDGTGYGEDGAIWGGEFLIASYSNFERYAHLQYFPLPGGDRSIRFPARIALSYLYHKGVNWSEDLASYSSLCGEERQLLKSQLDHQINLVMTSSMGRLFDIVAALLDIRQKINYEGQAAIELEAIADRSVLESYPYLLEAGKYSLEIDVFPMILQILKDSRSRSIPPSQISARFHNTIAELTLQICQRIHQEKGIRTVALSGGVWQNITLLSKTMTLLEQAGLDVLIHHQVPTNDGGIALGQAVIAGFKLRKQFSL